MNSVEILQESNGVGHSGNHSEPELEADSSLVIEKPKISGRNRSAIIRQNMVGYSLSQLKNGRLSQLKKKKINHTLIAAGERNDLIQ